MKKLLTLCLAIFITINILSMSSCSAKLVFKNGEFYCSKNNVTYKEADYRYLPVSISKEKYAVLDENGVKTELYSLENIAPEKWLATADGRLFHAADEKIPSLAEMETNKILICREGSNMSISLAEITSAESIESILNNIYSGNELEYPVKGEAAELLTLKMSSAKYPWLYYTLSYVEFDLDVCVKDYPDSMENYVYRDTDEKVKITTSSEFECWYKIDDESEREVLKSIANEVDIASGFATKPGANGEKLEYFGLFFAEGDTVEECINSLISGYEGTLAEIELKDILSAPDISVNTNIVEYNYGKYLIYDKTSGRCVMADTLLHEYKEQERHD